MTTHLCKKKKKRGNEYISYFTIAKIIKMILLIEQSKTRRQVPASNTLIFGTA